MRMFIARYEIICDNQVLAVVGLIFREKFSHNLFIVFQIGIVFMYECN